MNEHYGIDLGEPGLLERRSWRWLRVRVRGLLDVDGRLRATIMPTPKEGAP